MSASSKKKIRKEQYTAKMTERQQKAKKEARALRIYSIVFVVLIAAVILSALLTFAYKYYEESGWENKHTIAMTVGDHKINSVELTYYYMDLITATYNEWSNTYGESLTTMLSLSGLDLTMPLDEQPYLDSDKTWADYFLETAMKNASDDYILYDAAMADPNFAMTEEQEASFTTTMGSIEMSAAMYGLDPDDFVAATYGAGATYESYYEYQRRTAVANAYYQYKQDSLTYTDADYREYEKDRFGEFSSYTYSVYELTYSSFLGEGTTDESGNVTYTDEQIEAARAEAKKVADKLATSKTVAAFDKAIGNLAINKNATTTVTSSKYENVLYSNVTEVLREWISSPDRVENEVTVIEKISTTLDDEGNEIDSLQGYYVVYFQGSNDNKVAMGDVRHLLVAPETETHETTGEEMITDEAWDAAKQEAEMHLTAWKAANGTQDDFIELIHESSDDQGSVETGGLYTNINRDSSYVAEFLNWAIDPARTKDETGIIKTDYGYHIMYYVGPSALNYRDYMIDTALRNEDLTAWHEELTASVTVTTVDTSLINTSLTLMTAA